MTDQNNNNDKHIRDLLKWRLLEQAEDDDLLTQKLIDMEAKLVFSNEALLQPSLQKEKELLNKLTQTKSKNKLLKWILPSFLIVLTSIVILYYKNDTTKSIVASANTSASPGKNNNLPTIQTHTIESTDSTSGTVSTIVVSMTEEEIAIDSVRSATKEKWTVGDAGIKVDHKQSTPKKTTTYDDSYEGIPALSEYQKTWTKKMKEKLVKGVIKLDKNSWVYIPTSTESIFGDVVSVQGFYMLNMEVTNNTYRIFLNDLIIQDRFDDYIKAVPDTAKWLINGKSFYEPMKKNYFWHPAYDDYPVVNVSREGAKMYCVWLTRAVNEKMKASDSKEKFINDIRIPNEEEWMIAARGGKGDYPYPWSYRPGTKQTQNSKGCYLCNFSIVNYPDSLRKLSECSNDKLKNAITSAGSVSGDFYFTCKVNSYNPNDYGLYCICGNVSEMVWQYKTNKPCAKGGSWNSDADQVKVSSEPELLNVTEGNPALGFRPVFTAKKAK